MEEVNYKMEIEEEGCSQQVLLKKEEFNDQEKREAFKKKLRSFNDKSNT